MEPTDDDLVAVSALAAEAATEMLDQMRTWGYQRHPSIDAQVAGDAAAAAAHHGVPTETAARGLCEAHSADGTLTWADILIEEVAEVIDAAATAGPDVLRAELIQVAAVALSWSRHLDGEMTADE